MKIVVTGAAGFIGSAVCRRLLQDADTSLICIDKLTYAASPATLAPILEDDRVLFEKVDICDRLELERIFAEHRPDAVIHLAAESHVDRSIDGPGIFIQTNIVGTYQMLEVSRRYWNDLEGRQKAVFRFLHVSTDEVYGSLGESGLFSEETPYAPNSPYSASKASEPENQSERLWL